jgi:TonB family protein
MVFTNCGKQAATVALYLRTQFVPMKIFKITFFFLSLTVFQFSDANAQSLSSPDSSNYDKLTADVYKALKSENRKFLEPHIFDLNTFKEIILEISKEMPNLDMDYKTIQQNLEKELNDPKKTAQWIERLHQNIQEKYHRALAEIAEYGFNMKASKYLGHTIDPDREGNFWTYNIQFKITDKKDTLTIKLKSCIHYKNEWYLTEGIKVKRYYRPAPVTYEGAEELAYPYGHQKIEGTDIQEIPIEDSYPPVERAYPYEHQKIKVTDPYIQEIPMEDSYPPVEAMEDVPVPVMEEYEPNMNDSTTVYEIVEQMAIYPVDLREEIARKIQYPQYEKEMGIQGTLYTQFIIERNGSISDVKVLRNVPGSKNFDQEAKRILKSLDHQFQPAMHNGKKVRCRFTLPIKFVLQ